LEKNITEGFVFGLSFASFAIIVLYALYELLYPCLNRERLKLQTRLDYTRRYNREEHDLIKPYIAAKLEPESGGNKPKKRVKGSRKEEQRESEGKERKAEVE
jgi:hypothetical protein